MPKPELFGLIAHPVKHSLSPLMHNAAFQAMGLPYDYHAFDVSESELADALQSIRTLNIKGVNVSIPHKEAVIPYLDHVDPEAQTIGAVNTIIQTDGKLYGCNTDGEGYVRSLLRETKINLQLAQTLLIGAGGAAKGIAVYLLKHGCYRLAIANRTQEKANRLVIQLRQYAEQSGQQVQIEVLPWEKLAEHHGSFNLLIQTTSIGMWPNTEQVPFHLTRIRPNTVVSDIVYNPLETAFLKEAKQKQAIIHYGVGMFIHQGALAYEKFTDRKAPIELMTEVVMNHLQQGGT